MKYPPIKKNKGDPPVSGNILLRGSMNNQKIKKQFRIGYLKTFIQPLPHTCPECGNPLDNAEDEIYCKHCGLVTSASIRYVAGQKICLPYGIKI